MGQAASLEKGAVIVRSGKTQSARRRVPLAGRVLADLRGWVASQRLEPGDPFFPGLTVDRLRNAWEQIRDLLVSPMCAGMICGTGSPCSAPRTACL